MRFVARDHSPGEEEADAAHEHAAREDPAPRCEIGDDPAETRTEHDAGGDDRAVHADGATPFLRRERVGHERQTESRERCGADALDRPHRDQHLDGGSQRAQERPEREEGVGDEVDLVLADEVGEARDDR